MTHQSTYASSTDDILSQRRALLAHARHQLRTPLNAILGYSELILEELADADITTQQLYAPEIRRIYRAGEELLGMVTSLLDPETIERLHGLDLHEYSKKIAYELRTPLTAAIGYCEMLIEEVGADTNPIFETVLPQLRRIDLACKRLLVVSEEVLQTVDIETNVAVVGAAYHGQRDITTGLAESVPSRDDGSGLPNSVSATPVTARILVVDDNEMNRDVLSKKLIRQGHTVLTAENGRQALEMARSQPFDLVLLDVLMPELNGFETLGKFKADEAIRDIPIVMISALDEMESVVRCIELGAEDYLPKTFDPTLLKARIGACLEKKALRDREKLYIKQIEEERRRSDELLRVILPDQIVQELRSTNRVIPRLYQDVAVLFCDVVGFTPYCVERGPEEVIAHLQQLIERYEQLAAQHGMQKIKTIGDSFMATAGLLTPVPDPVFQCVNFGLDMVNESRRLVGWDVRVGVHVGAVVAGVVGRRQYLFDLWGDTVNTAARIESHGMNGAVNVSTEAWRRISNQFAGESLGLVPLKGKGELEIVRILSAQ